MIAAGVSAFFRPASISRRRLPRSRRLPQHHQRPLTVPQRLNGDPRRHHRAPRGRSPRTIYLSRWVTGMPASAGTARDEEAALAEGDPLRPQPRDSRTSPSRNPRLMSTRGHPRGGPTTPVLMASATSREIVRSSSCASTSTTSPRGGSPRTAPTRPAARSCHGRRAPSAGTLPTSTEASAWTSCWSPTGKRSNVSLLPGGGWSGPVDLFESATYLPSGVARVPFARDIDGDRLMTSSCPGLAVPHPAEPRRAQGRRRPRMVDPDRGRVRAGRSTELGDHARLSLFGQSVRVPWFKMEDVDGGRRDLVSQMGERVSFHLARPKIDALSPPGSSTSPSTRRRSAPVTSTSTTPS